MTLDSGNYGIFRIMGTLNPKPYTQNPPLLWVTQDLSPQPQFALVGSITVTLQLEDRALAGHSLIPGTGPEHVAMFSQQT